MKSDFHNIYLPTFLNKLIWLIVAQFITLFIFFVFFKDFIGSFYLFLGLILVISFKNFYKYFIREFNKISFYIMLVVIAYLSFPILVYIRYSYLNFFWVLLVPIGTVLFYNHKIVLKLCICVVFYSLLIFIIQSQIEIQKYYNLNPIHIKYGDYISILCILSTICFFIYEYYVIEKLYKLYVKDQKAKVLERQSQRFRLANENMLNEITQLILDNKLYTDYNLTIQMLSKSIGKSYFEISKILKNNNILSYKSYINSIRIQKIVERIEQGDLKNFTLQSIYKENGFEHQSTFNRVFKEITGKTPSDYVKNNLVNF